MDRGFFAVLLPTLECNLGCDYCFEAHPTGRWTPEHTGRVLEQVVAYARDAGFRRVRLHWQGGEPLLLGVEYWAGALERARELATRAGLELRQSMQTNLTLLEPAHFPLVREHLDGVVGTSFEPHDGRHAPGEDGAAFRRRWRERRDAALAAGIDVGVLSLLDAETIRGSATEHLERLRGEHGIRGVRFTLPFATDDGRGGWIDPERAGEFLAEAVRAWHARGGDDWMLVRPLSHLRARLAGTPPADSGLCLFHRNCADIAMTVDPSGDVMLCDNFAGERTAVWGNVFREPLVALHRGPARARVRAAVRALADDHCFACRWLPLCRGGCLVRSRPAGDTGRRRDHYCATYDRLFRALEATLAG